MPTMELGSIYRVTVADHHSGNMRHRGTLCKRGIVGVYMDAFEVEGVRILAFANWWMEDEAKFDEDTTEVAYVLELAILDVRKLE